MWLALSFVSLAAFAPQEATAEAPDRARLEAQFAELLTGARLVGYTTQLRDGEEPDGTLQPDSYRIDRVTKAEGNDWLFEASMPLPNNPERRLPIQLKLPVEWAGDTPVISVTERTFPLIGTYSARVLFYGEEYVGVWRGDGYGGQLFGRVERAEAVPAEAAAPEGEREDARGTGGGGALRFGVVVEPPADDPTTPADEWPSFRGFQAAGVYDGEPTPAEWDLEEGTNVAWRVEVPGLAHSSPVIWGDKLFVTTAIRVDGEQELRVGLYGDIAPIQDTSEFGFELLCYDKRTGERLWAKTAWSGVPGVKRHPKGSHAASTPATDGKRVVAFFGGEGLYAYDMDGELLWERDFGDLDAGFYMVKTAQWGFASSPVLHEDKVVVQVDVQEDSFVAVLDAATGETIWRTAREDVPTWSTPTVDVREGRAQVVCNGWKHAGGYDLATGAELWKIEGGGDIPVPTPIVSHGLVLITNAHGRYAPIYAVDLLKAKGSLKLKAEEEEAMVWSVDRRGNYMQTPLVYGDEAYFCNDSGILKCFDAATGKEHYEERLGQGRSGFTSSGIAANGLLYFASEEGEVHVVAAGPTFDFVGVSSLGEETMASPAVSDGVLYYRTRAHLVALGL